MVPDVQIDLFINARARVRTAERNEVNIHISIRLPPAAHEFDQRIFHQTKHKRETASRIYARFMYTHSKSTTGNSISSTLALG